MTSEAIRQRLMQDAGLYPELNGVRQPSKPSSTASRVSSNPAHRKTSTVVISSDDENENIPVVLDKGQRLSGGSGLPKVPGHVIFPPNARVHDLTKKVDTTKFPPPAPFGVPIRIPSNSNKPVLPPKAPELTEHRSLPDLGLPDDNHYTTPQDAERALRDLMSGGMNDNADTEIDMKDAIVEGFKEDVRLLPHQVLGRSWMKDREDVTKKRTGGILADDMGLGKTIQTLTRIVEGRARKSDRDAGWSAATLIVCPLALTGQWADEIAKMTVDVPVLVHHGTSRTTDPQTLRKYRVVITTYDVVKSEYEAYSPSKKETQKKTAAKTSTQDDDSDDSEENFGRTIASKKKAKTKSALFQVPWWRVVLDEAHNIKNEKTKGAIACCNLNGKFRWCLTGTPMQNSVTELYSLIKFLGIKPLNDWDIFNQQIAKPVKSGAGASRAMKRLQVVLQQIMLRRRKDQSLNGKALIELPKRHVEVVSCGFDSSEQTFYTALESKMEDVIEKIMAKGEGKSNYMSVLLLLLRLRQACNHPVLVAQDYGKDMDAVEPMPKTNIDDDADDLVGAFAQLGVVRKCQVCMIELDASNTKKSNSDNICIDCAPLAERAKQATTSHVSSAKIRMLMKLLGDVEKRSKEEKTIVFSQFTKMLDLIEPFLRDNTIKYVRYDGSMDAKSREASLHAIKNDQDVRVILISFKAGSTGLNLTACNNVILVDLWWNPALEDQAFDRAHRFGQTRDVNIFKLKIDNTVEDRILMLQEKKRELARAALDGNKIKNMRLGMEELLALFRHSGHDDDDDDD